MEHAPQLAGQLPQSTRETGALAASNVPRDMDTVAEGGVESLSEGGCEEEVDLPEHVAGNTPEVPEVHAELPEPPAD